MPDLIAIVPAKATSQRVPNKNYRPFVDGKSLVDLTLEKLTVGLPGDRIWLSCEDESKREVAERHGVQFHLRCQRLTYNGTPIPDYIRGISWDVWKKSGKSGLNQPDIAWCQVIDPLFDEYEAAIRQWLHMRELYDSLVVVRRRTEYLLDHEYQPIGFGFDRRHVPSQKLRPYHQLPFVLSILSPAALADTGYFVGLHPCWFVADGRGVDIDTEEDFAFAAQLVKWRAEQRKLGENRTGV